MADAVDFLKELLRYWLIASVVFVIFYGGYGMYTKDWFKAAGVRALKTVCQTAAAMIGTAAVIADVDWGAVVSASILAGFLSLLTSVAGLPELKANEDTAEDSGDDYEGKHSKDDEGVQ